jgi:hypothetical protein
MAEFDFNRAIARIPRWLLLLAAVGTVVALLRFGVSIAGGFLLGALAAWFNLKLVERAARRVTAADTGSRSGARGLFIQFSGLVLGGFVIIHFSGFSLPAAFVGFFACPAAVLLEIIYELLTPNR